MKASVFAPLVVVFVAVTEVCAASSVDEYKNVAMSGSFTPQKGYSGDLSLLAGFPNSKNNREPRSSASGFLIRSRELTGPRVKPAQTALGEPTVSPAPEIFRFDSRPETLPSFRLLPPLSREKNAPW